MTTDIIKGTTANTIKGTTAGQLIAKDATTKQISIQVISKLRGAIVGWWQQFQANRIA